MCVVMWNNPRALLMLTTILHHYCGELVTRCQGRNTVWRDTVDHVEIGTMQELEVVDPIYK